MYIPARSIDRSLAMHLQEEGRQKIKSPKIYNIAPKSLNKCLVHVPSRMPIALHEQKAPLNAFAADVCEAI
jgi:hypothetical protein